MKQFSDKRTEKFALKTDFLGSVFLLLALFVVAGAGSNRESHDLILESARSNENRLSGGEFVSILRGDVVFTYGDQRISSAEATWWKNRGAVNFRRDVRVERPSQLITCDRMSFTRDDNLLHGSGNFHFFDTLEHTTIRASDARYRIDTGELVLRGNPEIERVDTVEGDTLVITGEQMIYTDEDKVAVVEGGVGISKGALSATSAKADYHTQSGSLFLRSMPQISYESHTVKGDMAELFFGEEKLEWARMIGNAFVVYNDYTSDTTDTMLTRIWGDTLLLTLRESGDLDSLYAYGNVITRYHALNDTVYVNKTSGREMVLSFGDGGVLDNVLIRGNARSVYYIEQDDGRGRNEASGDSLTVIFEEGKTRRIRLSGSTRGMYYSR